MKKYNLGRGKSKNRQATSDYSPRTKVQDFKKIYTEGTRYYARLCYFTDEAMKLCEVVTKDGEVGYQPLISYRNVGMINPNYDESQNASQDNPKWVYHTDRTAIGMEDEAKAAHAEILKKLIAEDDEDTLELYNDKFYNAYNPLTKNKEDITTSNPLSWNQMTRENFIVCLIPVDKTQKEIDGEMYSVPTLDAPILMKVPSGIANRLFPFSESDQGRVFSDDELAEDMFNVDLIFYKNSIGRWVVDTRKKNPITPLTNSPSGATPETIYSEATLPDPIEVIKEGYNPQTWIEAFRGTLELDEDASTPPPMTRKSADAKATAPDPTPKKVEDPVVATVGVGSADLFEED